jgi:hypothetical protein
MVYSKKITVGCTFAILLLTLYSANSPVPSFTAVPSTSDLCIYVVGHLSGAGYPLRGYSVIISAEPLGLAFGLPLINDVCGGDFDATPSSTLTIPQYDWNLIKPFASTAGFVDTSNPLAKSLLLDKVGDYTIQFRICQPSGCDINVFGETHHLQNTIKEIAIHASDSISVPGDIVQWADSANFDKPDFWKSMTPDPNFSGRNPCPGYGYQWFDRTPEWVTIKPYHTNDNYQKLEGLAYRDMGVSVDDGKYSHYYMDQHFKILPDPAYNNLRGSPPDNPGREYIEAEVEHKVLPEYFWPTLNDRVSVFGHYIFDCGHGDPDKSPPELKTEIHPHVAIGVQRYRPVAIPAKELFDFDNNATTPSESVGKRVYVPGIITDLHISNNVGYIVDTAHPEKPDSPCGDRGLHQAKDYETSYPADKDLARKCILEPVLIDKKYEFNIYLPRDPHDILTELAPTNTAPPVPLYAKAQTHPYSYPDASIASKYQPVIEHKTDSKGVDYLKVTIDLTGYTGSEYVSRIVAGWVLADQDNWGLESWRLKIKEIIYRHSMDGDDYGDWFLWFNLNNGLNEWHNLKWGSDSVHVRSIESDPLLETGILNTKLGPDILLFPGQDIQVQTAAYEDDGSAGSKTALVDAPGHYLAKFATPLKEAYNDEHPYPLERENWRLIPVDRTEACEDLQSQVNEDVRIYDICDNSNYTVYIVLSSQGKVTPCYTTLITCSSKGVVPSLSPGAQKLHDQYNLKSSDTNIRCLKRSFSSSLPFYDDLLRPAIEIAPKICVLVSVNSLYKASDLNFLEGFESDTEGVPSAEQILEMRAEILDLIRTNPSLFEAMMAGVRNVVTEGTDQGVDEELEEIAAFLDAFRQVLPAEIYSQYLGDIQLPKVAKFIPMEAGNSIYRIEVQNKTFDIPVIGEGVKSLVFDQEDRTITLENNGASGLLQLDVPIELLSGNFTVLADGNPIQYKSSKTNSTTVLLFDRPENSNTVIIEGANVIPEFPLTIVTFSATLGIVTVILRYLFKGYRRWRR